MRRLDNSRICRGLFLAAGFPLVQQGPVDDMGVVSCYAVHGTISEGK